MSLPRLVGPDPGIIAYRYRSLSFRLAHPRGITGQIKFSLSACIRLPCAQFAQQRHARKDSGVKRRLVDDWADHG
jgi:hypothetical protein